MFSSASIKFGVKISLSANSSFEICLIKFYLNFSENLSFKGYSFEKSSSTERFWFILNFIFNGLCVFILF